jgi:hypothetical protein
MDETVVIARSPRGAAKAANVGVNKIYEWLNDKTLRAKKDNGRTLITDEALKDKIASLPDYEPKTHEAPDHALA